MSKKLIGRIGSSLRQLWNSTSMSLERSAQHRRDVELKHGYSSSPGFVAGCLVLGVSAVLAAGLIALADISPLEWVKAWEAARAALSDV